MKKRWESLLKVLFLLLLLISLISFLVAEFYNTYITKLVSLIFFTFVGIIYAMIIYKRSNVKDKQKVLLSLVDLRNRRNDLVILVVIIFYLILIPFGIYKTITIFSWSALVVITVGILVVSISYKIMQLDRRISHQQKMILATIFVFSTGISIMFLLFEFTVGETAVFPPEILFFGIIAVVIVILVFLPTLVKRGL